MATLPLPKISAEEYLLRDRAAAYKSEYCLGHMYAIAGASLRHAIINRNVLLSLSRLEGFTAVSSDLRVYSPKNPFFAYPDTVIYCGEPELRPDEVRDTSLNPRVVIEILSPSTREYDLGLKFELYKDISTLQEYLAVEQDQPSVRQFCRDSQGWRENEILADRVKLLSIQAEICFTDLYRTIEFTE